MADQNQQPNPPSSSDSLYCDEEHWEESDSGDNVCSDAVLLMQEECLWDEEELSSLISKEDQDFPYYNGDGRRSSFAGTRRAAVEWILNVVAYYSFSSLTAVLAVNYLDRFLFTFKSQTEKPWISQLAAVACLSLAAKIEETQVPLLLDLQVEEESKYIFEAITIQKMEILVLSALKWKMNPVTALSFVDYITRRLRLKIHLCRKFLNRCEYLLLSVIADCRSMYHRPSVIATATMLHIADNVAPCLGLEYQTQLLGILGIDRSKLGDCSELIREVASGVRFDSTNKLKFGSLSGSPKGVMDASFSSDSSNDSWSVAAAGVSVSCPPEPMFKRSRAPDQPFQSPKNQETADFFQDSSQDPPP